MTHSALEKLSDYPFQRLRNLLEGVTPPGDQAELIMSIGEPQHAPPALLQDTIAAHATLWNKYPPVAGAPVLLEAIRSWIARTYAPQDQSYGIVPLCGTKEGLFLAGNLILDPPATGKDLVLVPNPFYQVYVGAAALHGAEAVFLPATHNTGFQPDLEAVDDATWQRTAMLFLCSPGNPQGSVTDHAYLVRAINLARQHNFVLVMDECYAELYDRDRPAGVLAVADALGAGYDNILAFHSLSKRSSAAGLRSGFVAGDPALVKSFVHLRNYGAATLSLPLQHASAALWNDDAHVIENRALYQAKFDTAEEILGGRLGFYRPAGGFFLWLDVSERWTDGEAATLEIWERCGVKVLPGAYFAKTGEDGTNPGDRYIRLALVHPEPMIRDALGRIAAIL